MKKRKILVIGHEGYIGSKLIEILNKNEYVCFGLDKGYFKNGVLYDPIEINTLNKDVWTIDEKDIEPFQAVILLAAMSNDPFGNLSADDVYNPTRLYTKRIAKLCKKTNVRFIFPSSCSIYGVSNKVVSETDPANPQTPYSLNKVQIESDLEDLSDSNFSPIILRLATLFGSSPRIRFDLVINMFCGMAITNKKILLNSNGLAWRPYVNILDVCNIITKCIDLKIKDKEKVILNIGREENNMQVIKIAEIIKNKVEGCEIENLSKSEMSQNLFSDKKIQDGHDKRTYRVNFSQFRNYFPEYTFNTSIEEDIENFIDQLKHYGLSKNLFLKKDFYRLQQLDYLLSSNKIDNKLEWL